MCAGVWQRSVTRLATPLPISIAEAQIACINRVLLKIHQQIDSICLHVIVPKMVQCFTSFAYVFANIQYNRENFEEHVASSGRQGLPAFLLLTTPMSRVHTSGYFCKLLPQFFP